MGRLRTVLLVKALGRCPLGPRRPGELALARQLAAPCSL